MQRNIGATATKTQANPNSITARVKTWPFDAVHISPLTPRQCEYGRRLVSYVTRRRAKGPPTSGHGNRALFATRQGAPTPLLLATGTA